MMFLMAQQETEPLFKFSLGPLTEEHGIPLAIMGILVVFSALVLIVIFITLLPRLVAPFSAAGQKASAALPVAASDDLAEETLVIIAAAVAEVLDQPHRIVKIRGQGGAEHAWSMEGRMQHHRSHRIHHRGR
jgi:Na+-transporting methylmalonyl-CoA/oxaloacetate decarboxylase gamma subunit